MVRLNALNNGRPVPDMDKIQGGWVTSISPGQSREEIASKLVDAIKADGVTVSASKTSDDPIQDNAEE
jgi:hypothetical protein